VPDTTHAAVSAAERSELAGAASDRGSGIPSRSERDQKFGVYVHVPFCAARCDYCDFATWTDRAHLVDDYVDACVTDLARRAGEGYPAATSVFFGGGTPSLLPAGQLVRILDTKDLEQILVAQLFRVVAEVRGDRAFRPLGVLRLESVTRDFIEAHRVGDEYPDFVEHGRGERILPFDVDVHPHIATAHRQVELPVATLSNRKLGGTDYRQFKCRHDE